MAEHTPGPWILELEFNTKGFQKILGGQWGMHNIAQVVKRQSMKDEDEANIRLVASSPNLLAAAKLAQSLLGVDASLGAWDDSEQYGDSYEVLKRLDAAIAKAEGN